MQSFIRVSSTSTSSFRAALTHARRYSTPPTPATKSASNLPIWLFGAGIGGLAAYVYLDRTSPAQPAQKLPLKSALDPDNFLDFKLKKVESYNYNTAKFIFELPAGSASLLPVASCVIVKSPQDAPSPLLDPKGKPVIRPYTPISPSEQPGELTFLVKKYDQGKMSKYIHDLQLGDKLSIKGPIPKFDFKVNQFDEVGMIAGGTGITPMYQILDYALKDPSNKTRFTLVFANISERDILMKDEFDALRAKYPKTFNVVYTVDKPEANWKGATGYVNSDLVSTHLPPAKLGDKTKIFVCGPPGQVAAIAGKKDGMKQGELGGVLKELGFSEDQVFKF